MTRKVVCDQPVIHCTYVNSYELVFNTKSATNFLFLGNEGTERVPAVETNTLRCVPRKSVLESVTESS